MTVRLCWAPVRYPAASHHFRPRRWRGTHSIKAVYGGDTNVNGATSAVLSQTVKQKEPSRAAILARPSDGLSYNREVFRFELQSTCPETGARAGIVHTPHGDVETPVFMPVGTQGTVKGIVARDLLNDLDNRRHCSGSSPAARFRRSASPERKVTEIEGWILGMAGTEMRGDHAESCKQKALHCQSHHLPRHHRLPRFSGDLLANRQGDDGGGLYDC
jgi:hypothetical protein